MPDFLPRRESDLAVAANRFATGLLELGPMRNVDQARIDAFIELHTRFQAAYLLANSGTGRSPANLLAKADAKAAMLSELRSIARALRAGKEPTGEQLSRLGLRRHSRTRSQPVPPSLPPTLSILHADSTTLRVHLGNRERPDSAAVPPGTWGVQVYVHIDGPTPADVKQWHLRFPTTRMKARFNLPLGIAPGATLWVTAAWALNGPDWRKSIACDPQCKVLGQGPMHAPDPHASHTLVPRAAA